MSLMTFTGLNRTSWLLLDIVTTASLIDRDPILLASTKCPIEHRTRSHTPPKHTPMMEHAWLCDLAMDLHGFCVQALEIGMAQGRHLSYIAFLCSDMKDDGNNFQQNGVQQLQCLFVEDSWRFSTMIVVAIRALANGRWDGSKLWAHMHGSTF